MCRYVFDQLDVSLNFVQMSMSVHSVNTTVRTDVTMSCHLKSIHAHVQMDTNSVMTIAHAKTLTNALSMSILLLLFINMPTSSELNTCADKLMECKNSVGFYSCHCGQGMRRNPTTNRCEGEAFIYLFTVIIYVSIRYRRVR